MHQLIKTKYIETSLLYEVDIHEDMPKRTEVIRRLESIGVITGDADVFVLTEEQYGKFATYLRDADLHP